MRTKTIGGIIAFALGGLLAFGVHTAFALADPDVINIESVNRYDDVAVTGDMFILVEYTINYTVLPTENIAQGWVGRLIDNGGSGQLASVAPFAGHDIPDLGYSRGTYGFYFQVEPTITGTLRVTLEGNPALSPTPTGVYSESITLNDASELAGELRAQAIRFEDVWTVQSGVTVDLISPVTGGINRYTEDGEHYFSSALPSLRALAPDLFLLQSVTPEVSDRSYDTTHETALFNIWAGTPVETGFQSLGTALGVSEVAARFIVAFIISAGAAILIGRIEGIKELPFAIALQGMVWYLGMMACYGFGLVAGPVLGFLLIVLVMIMAVQIAMNRSGL